MKKRGYNKANILKSILVIIFTISLITSCNTYIISVDKEHKFEYSLMKNDMNFDEMDFSNRGIVKNDSIFLIKLFLESDSKGHVEFETNTSETLDVPFEYSEFVYASKHDPIVLSGYLPKNKKTKFLDVRVFENGERVSDLKLKVVDEYNVIVMHYFKDKWVISYRDFYTGVMW